MKAIAGWQHTKSEAYIESVKERLLSVNLTLEGISTEAVMADKAFDADALPRTIVVVEPRPSFRLALTETRHDRTIRISTSTAISLNANSAV